ncbi:hypothetical protein HN652_03455 [archaeon]|nr:hypothetical protein [archaeon]MBT6869515.1 hypothetical protein [archaeon]MBT7193203.1 hypothetical protein [archaeon]MBT7380509.1 hypothetical protein [archaeon]MBT7508047.1 hypothetical protein [archaeon]
MKKREFGWKVITYNLEKLAKVIRWIIANLFWDSALYLIINLILEKLKY